MTMIFPTIGTPSLWLGFGVLVLAMLAIDLGIFHRTAHEVRLGEALAWSAVWICVALLFNLGRFRYLDVGLSIVLVFVGGKMLLAPIYELPIGASLAVIAALLAASIFALLILNDRNTTSQRFEAKPWIRRTFQ